VRWLIGLDWRTAGHSATGLEAEPRAQR
jgi:hypothetical protein